MDLETVLTWTMLIGLIIVSLVGGLLVLFGLPGTWLIVLASGLMSWFFRDHVGYIAVASLAGLAVLGEVLEFLAGGAGTRKSGGSKRAAALAILGGIIGAVVGTIVLPVPIVGTILGACIGAAMGAMSGDRWAGRTWHESVQSGRGAAWGQFLGTMLKGAVAGVMLIVVIVTVAWI